MEYLDKVLGVKVTYEDVEFKHLPNFIATRYRLRMVSMNEQKMIFLYPKTELERIETLKKHIERIKNTEKRIFSIGGIFYAKCTQYKMLLI